MTSTPTTTQHPVTEFLDASRDLVEMRRAWNLELMGAWAQSYRVVADLSDAAIGASRANARFARSQASLVDQAAEVYRDVTKMLVA
jgi:hypothetical protein